MATASPSDSAIQSLTAKGTEAPAIQTDPKVNADPKAAGQPTTGASSSPVAKTAKSTAGNEADAGAKAPQRERRPFSLHGALRQTPSWLVSLVVHMVALISLMLWQIDVRKETKLSVVVSPPPETEELDNALEEKFDKLEIGDPEIQDPEPDTAPEIDIPNNPIADDVEAAPLAVELSEFGEFSAPKEDLLKTVGAIGGVSQGVGGRTGKVKSDLVRRGGGTDASEAAVARALKWFAAHQMPDGGWIFDLKDCPNCKGRCKDSGTGGKEVRLAATAMALLPFLGAGHTHKEGEYKQVVQNGLYFLTNNMVRSGNGLSMFEPGGGTMYSHGLGAIVVCEAYAMTQDRTLMPYAKGAVEFIAYAQDPVGGGWRYDAPSRDGDTSVVGWQIMALKSARLAYVPASDKLYRNTFKKASDFLDSVQTDDGAAYGYTQPQRRASTTAIGLLCRMYLGWKRDNPALGRGVRALAQRGPSFADKQRAKIDLYYDYYATQVLRHWGGEEWENWNSKMRDWLVAEQARKGHEVGSWYMDDLHGQRGGRLYCTSLSTLILEVYYRHLPLYGGQAVEDEFAVK